MNKKITVTVSGATGSGKTTVASLIRMLLKAQDFKTALKLADNEMPPCPATLRQRTHSLIDSGVFIEIVEGHKKPDTPNE